MSSRDFKITAAESLRSFYILSNEPCHLVDNCVQCQYNALYTLQTRIGGRTCLPYYEICVNNTNEQVMIGHYGVSQ